MHAPKNIVYLSAYCLLSECHEKNIAYCKKISIDFESFMSGKSLKFPDDVVLDKDFEVDSSSKDTVAYSYKV